MTEDQLERLTDLLAQPTAPFREQHISRWAARFLERHGVPFFNDPAGNLVVGADSRHEYLKKIRATGDEPLRLFIAHMDHPGFHGTRWLGPDRLRIKWYGGSPLRRLAGAHVRLADDTGPIATGRLTRVRLNREGTAIDNAEVRLSKRSLADVPRPAARDVFGGFAFRAPVWQGRGRLYCPAMDDLIGVFAILETARAVWRGGARGRASFAGLLTRAEEVGFVGAVAHLELGWLYQPHRPIVAISLEASRALPGAAIGRGPVVRLGDRRTVFHPDMLKVLSEAAAKTLPGRHQRRIMDGGSCEATAMTAWGLPTVGLSIPLGNYHNQSLEGGPDSIGPGGPAPEFISLDDAADLLRLCRALMRTGLPWQSPWASQRRRLYRNLVRHRRLLQEM